MKEYEVNDVVEMKKIHPCGSYTWKIIRLGADIKIKCTQCDRMVMIQRKKFDRNIKKIL